jgi:hypothetical protein
VNPDYCKSSATASLISLIVSVAATSWCWWLAGAGLALFLGAVLLAAFYVPSTALAEQRLVRWLTAWAVVVGICGVWLASLPYVDVTLSEWFRCDMICIAFVFALVGIASSLARLRMAAPIAATTTLTLAIAWLTWPVWLSPLLTQRAVNWLVPAHPLLAINGVLQHLGSWDRAPIAYRQLTILNQDIPYHLPRSIFPAVAVHTAIAIMGLLPLGPKSSKVAG